MTPRTPRGALLDPALLRLVQLNLRGRRRRAFRGLRTAKGIVYAVIVCGIFAMWIGPAIAAGFLARMSDPAAVRTYAPIGMLAFCVVQLLTLKPESGVPFLPAEVDFLFPGPFSRRALLAYKLVGMVLTSAILAFFFSLYFMPYVRLWLAAYFGSLFALLFVQFFQIGAALFAATVAEQAFTMARKVVLTVVAIGVAIGLGFAISTSNVGDVQSIAPAFRASWAGAILLAPFQVFGRTLGAETFYPELIGWGAAAAALDAAFAVMILRLDANFLEASVVASEKLYQRIQRVRQGTVWAATANRAVVARRVPKPPWLGGAGPIAWRQACAAWRGSRGILLTLAIVAVSAGIPMIVNRHTPGDRNFAGVPLISVLGTLSIFLVPQMIRFDFRSEMDRIETLKALPIAPHAIVIGEMLTPIVVATFAELLIVAVIALFVRLATPWIGLVALFVLPLNLLVFGLENLVFLLFPYRMPAGGGLDVQTMGRQMLIMFLKVCALALLAGLAAGIGGIGYFVADSRQAFVVGAWISATLLGLACVPVVGWAYRRFDPSTDTPP